MKRREFIAITAAAAAMPLVAGAVGVQYAPGLAQSELASGKTIFLDFNATWCSTCAAQGRVIEALRAADPAYNENIAFINVDWDNYGNGDLARTLNIPRRSTLVVIKGNQELGRIVAGTSKKAIKQLMDIALDAAVA